VEVCSLLLAAGADVNIQNEVSNFMLRSASRGYFHTVTITRGTVGIPGTVAVVRSND
jgi:hypothetical protein